ncbi:MAG: universal stress protein [Ardenticatenaceae bacterium]|nr:universal stress protein [Ardenticatenaceae bacterium]
MFSHLLVPLDGSELAEKALEAATKLAKKFDAKMTLVHVLVNMPQASILAHESHDELFDRVRKEAYEIAIAYLERIERSLREQGINVQIHFAEGRTTSDSILAAAEEVQADAIVMSTHGRSGFNRLVFGSVAEKVLRKAEVPLVLVR